MAPGVMSEKRLLLARLAEAQDSARGGPKRRALKRTAAVLVLVALVVALMLWLSGFFSTPKEVLEIRAMVDEQIGQLQKVAADIRQLEFQTELGSHAGHAACGPRPDAQRDGAIVSSPRTG